MCDKGSGRSETLVEVAKRLRNYKAAFSKDSRNHELGPQAAGASRAAVLICLFEGEKGDLRVILTKRSSNMSSHSGNIPNDFCLNNTSNCCMD